MSFHFHWDLHTAGQIQDFGKGGGGGCLGNR